MLTHAELSALADRWGEHFYLAYPACLAENLAHFHAAFAAVWPRSTVCYSVKTNYLPAFLKIVRDAGHGAEVVSGAEYELARRLGFPPERIVLNGPVKSAGLLRAALEAGSRVHLDSPYEIDNIERSASQSDTRRWRLGLRCNLDLGSPSRFGFDVGSGDLAKAARRLEAIPNVRVRGLHLHQSQPKTLPAFAARVRGLLGAAGEVFGERPPEYLDVGGGFRSPATPGTGPAFAEYAAAAAGELGRRYGSDGPELLTEPGLAVTLDTMRYVCRVLDVKTAGGRRVAVTTGSMQTIRPTDYERHEVIAVVPSGPGSGRGARVALGGYTCIDHDVLAVGFAEPVAPGDFLLVSNLGAYTTVLKPPFIATAPAILVPAEGGWECVRRAETVDDWLR
jgi:diaminopimelate decarboxylase